MTIDCDKTLVSTLQYSCREFDEDSGFASSKVLLTAPFSELRTESGSVIHSVQLVLTTDCEIIVLKKSTDKLHRYTCLRKHKLNQTEFSMHSFMTNSFTAIVPDTILRYTYQLYGTPSSSIGEWLLKIAHCKMNKKGSSKEKNNSASVNRENTSTAGQSTNYQSTGDETLHSNAYSSPTHPVQRHLTPQSLPSTSTSTSEQVQHPLMNEHSRQTLVQMPSGLIKARSFQERGSVKHHFVRSNSSSVDLNQTRRISEDFSQDSTSSTPLPDFEPRTPSPITDDINPFESRLRHTQVRNKKRVYSPRIMSRCSSSQSSTNPTVEELKERSFYSRSANSTPLPGLTSSLVIASPSAAASDMAGPSYTRGSSGTLPRSKKGKKDRYLSTSDSTNGTSPSKTPGKSPKLLSRMFHRRWQSSSAIKVPLDLDGDEQPSTSSEMAPRKLYQFSPKEVAEELSLMDAELLRKIYPEELQNGAWMKKDQKDKLAPNVMAMVRSFNQLALLIPSEILEEKTPQGRAKIITTYIQIASKLYSSHNYNSLMAVVAGLQSASIYRLKKTWKEVPSKRRKRFEQLCALMSACENWQLYRNEIDRKFSSDSPFIPFFGQFLTQVVQTDSYNQAKEDRKASVSPSEAHSKSLSAPESKQRKRSSSLSDAAVHSTSSPAHIEPSSEEPSISSLRVEDISLSISAPVTPIHPGFKAMLAKKNSSSSSQSSDSDKDQSHSKSLSFDSNCLSPPPSVNVSDEDEIDGHDDNGSHTTDSGHHSSSGIELRLPPAIPKSSSHTTLCIGACKEGSERNSQLELSQIYVSLQRHSQSYEGLLDRYTKEDPRMKSVLHTTLNELTRFSASLQSLDSVFSEDEDEENGQRCSSLNVSCPPELGSDPDHTSDYGSDVNSVQMELPQVKASPRPRRILFRAVSDNSENVCPLSPEGEQLSLEQQVDDTAVESSKKKSAQIQRSKSCSTGSKFPKRRRNKKLRKAYEGMKDSHEQLPSTPAEMLNSFQTASLRCSVGVRKNSELRNAICSTEPYSESASFKLSVEREAVELNH